MARLPRYLKLEHIGHDGKNALFRLKIKRWAIPWILLLGLFRRRYPLAESCDGLRIADAEVVE